MAPAFASKEAGGLLYLVYTCKAWGNTRSSGKRSFLDRIYI